MYFLKHMLQAQMLRQLIQDQNINKKLKAWQMSATFKCNNPLTFTVVAEAAVTASQVPIFKNS